MQAADDLAGGEVQRGVEAGGAGAFVVVGGALGGAREHRQDRRGAVERLDLGLLIDAQHDGALGRVEVEPDDVADLLDEQRVLGELPRLLAVRLQPERLPDPVHRRLRQADLGAIDRVDQCVASFGVALQRLDDHLLDLRVGDRPRPARAAAHRSARPGDARQTACATPRRRDVDPEPLGDLGRSCSPSAAANTIRERTRQRLRARTPTRPRLQLLALGLGELDHHRARIRHTPPIPATAELMHQDTSRGR